MAAALLTTAICTFIGPNNTAPPFHFPIGSGYYALATYDRLTCPPIKDFEVTYYYYSRKNRDNPKILIYKNNTSWTSSKFNTKLPTKLFVHGFTQSHESTISQELMKAYLSIKNCNVILVDAKVLFSGPNYLAASNNVIVLGEYISKFVCWLISKGMNLETLEILGMSLGSQTIGIIGQNMKKRCGKPPKLVAYEAASPLFLGKPIDERLDPSDGDLVIAMHSNWGFFGYPTSIGHVDFYINNPIRQPGCGLEYFIKHLDPIGTIFCNHNYVWRAAIYAITRPKVFPARKCDSLINYTLGKCNNNELQYLGDILTGNATGDYYVTSGEEVYVIS